MRVTFLKGIAIGSVTTALALTAASALAGSGIGGVFNLGVENGVNAQTVLRGTTANPQLKINNQYSGDTGVGIQGIHSAASGRAPGLQGETSSTAGCDTAACLFLLHPEGARGILGTVNPTSPGAYSAGVRGISKGTTGKGIGVYGSHDGSGWGVYGVAPTGTGVYGMHFNAAGTAPGVLGETNSTAANAAAIVGRVSSTAPGAGSAAVRGINNGTGGSGVGVWGSQSGSGWGVYGQAPSGTGVVGQSTTGTGVYGQSQSGRAGVFAGNVDVDGYLRLGRTNGPPPAQACDEDSEFGRIVVNNYGSGYDRLLWVCLAGWRKVDTHA